MALTLKHLHLNPSQLSSLPDEDSDENKQFKSSLLKEALELLDSDLWTDSKQHHGGIVETFGFPVNQIKYETEEKGQATVSPTGKFSITLVRFKEM